MVIQVVALPPQVGRAAVDAAAATVIITIGTTAIMGIITMVTIVDTGVALARM